MAKYMYSNQSHMSQTVIATNMSINSFISDRVQPMINNWEKDIKETKRMMESKTNEERRHILMKKVLEMSDQTKQLQYHSGNEGTNVSVTKSKAISVSDHMVMMTEEWKKRCKHLKDQSAKRTSIPNLQHILATLVHDMQRYLQYWMQLLTGSESMQQQNRASAAQHSGTHWQQPQNHPQNVLPSTDGVEAPGQHTSEASLTKDKQQKLLDEISNLQMKYDSKVAENLEYKNRNSQHAADMDKIKEEMERLREELNKQVMINHQVAREKDEALNRLSEKAGQKLRNNNPAIMDLSTDNRPTKIAERFKELYTNQWTDAFTELTKKGCSETEAINILLGSVEDSFSLTASISEKQMKQLEHSAQVLAYIENTPNKRTEKMQSQTDHEHTKDKKLVQLSAECTDQLKQVLKASAPALVLEVQQCFLKEKQGNIKFPGENVQIAMNEYYKECAAITWFMNIQTPPLSLAPKPAKGTHVQTDLYSFYTQSGEKVDYVVWPACLLHENGPLLTKGIVQPFKTEERMGAKKGKENGRSDTPEKGPGGDRKSIIDQSNVNTSSGRKFSKEDNQMNTQF